MKKIGLLLLIVLALLAINIFATKPNHKAKEFKLTASFVLNKDASVPANFADTLKKAQELLSKVFSSDEFKDIMYKQSYNDSSYSKTKSGCFDKVYDTKSGRVSGKAVYDNLMMDGNVSLLITIKNNGTKKGTMGSSNACINKITTYDYWLVEKPGLAQRLARHIAHEFTHIRGYRHDNRVPKEYKWGRKLNEDPAYGVGSIVGEILTRWTKQGLI
jgi:hypothetical protein